jgi:hypothetical protein
VGGWPSTRSCRCISQVGRSTNGRCTLLGSPRSQTCSDAGCSVDPIRS